MDSVKAEKTVQHGSSEDLFFDINAKLDEQKRSGDQAVLSFELSITTKPNVVKYTVTGTATLEGNAQEVKKKLEINPKTKIPQILFTVYQHVFGSIYILSSMLNTPYPPPDLLHPMQEKIQILRAASNDEGAQRAKEQETPAGKPPAQETTTPPA